ncbi:MAG: hypothetical protein ACE5GY_09850 [Thermodesulfobacteriota bacterium]
MLKKTKSFAASIKGAEVTEEQAGQIRKFTLADIPSEELYVRRIRLAHNAIDRDNERFGEKVLEDFAATLPGKSLLIGHNWGPPGSGLFFDAMVEEMGLKEARAETGEELRLPDGEEKVKFLYAWFYTTKAGKEAFLADIDAGIIRHASIGFNAANLVRVNDEKSGETLYWEYKAPAEALEGSLVWLGAQPGATITKSVQDSGADIDDNDKKNKKEKIAMKTIFEKLGLDADSTEDQAVKALNLKLARLKGLEDIVEPLGENATKEHVLSLIAGAEDGKAYRKDLVSRQVKCERLLGRVGDTDEEAEARGKQLARRDLSEIKGDISYLEKQVKEKFPDQAAIEGGDPGDERDNTEAGAKKYNFRKKAG